MGETTFTPDNIVETGDSFPRFKLEKGDTKRIVCLENPFAAWTHNLRAPKILNGRPVMEKKKTQQGEEYEVYQYDFIGNPICIGDEGILKEKFFDAQNCPACAYSEISDSVRKPQRRFAMNVMEYTNINKNGQVVDPFGVRTVIWGFTDTVFAKLVGFAQEYTGGLVKHDLICGPCEDKQFQKFNIMASERAEWLASDERKALTIATYQGNKVKAEERVQFCGTKKERPWIDEALKRIVGRWNIVNGTVTVAGPTITMVTNGGASLEHGLDGLLNDIAGNSSPPQEPAASSPNVNLDDLLSQGAAQPAVPATVPPAASDDPLAGLEPEPELPAAPKPASSGETMDFEKMLQGLGN